MKPLIITSLSTKNLNKDRNKSYRKNTYTSNTANSVDKEENINFDEIHEILVESFNRKKYRKVFEFIDTKETILEQYNISNQFFFSHMKMNCVLKIIDKKINKYYKSAQLKGIEKWFKFADLLLNKFSFLTNKIIKTEKKVQCEYIILYHIKIYYYHALYCKFKSDNKEYIYHLIMAEEIIQNIIDKITFPETFIYIIRIYLLLSNLLIQDNAFFSSINYLLSILQICKIVKRNEINIKQKNEKNDKTDHIFITNKENEINNNNFNINAFIKEIDFLSSITFCLLGACFENLNEFFLSFSAYRQAKWISDNSLYEYSELSKLLGDLCDKSKKEKNLITILCKLDMKKFINKHKNKPKKKSFDSFDKKKILKYKIIEQKISKLQLKESEQLQQILLNDNDENKQRSKAIKLMTNNVVLLNYLSSDQFKPVVYNIKNMNLYNMNKETEMLITKKLEKIKNKKKANEKNKSKKSYHSDNDSSCGFKNFRKRKRFQTAYNKDIHLLNNEDKFNDRIFKKSPTKKNNDNKNRLKLNIQDNRKLSIETGNDLNNNFSLNESSFLENNNYMKQKDLMIDNSLSNKKSSDLSGNSSILILLNSPKKNQKNLSNDSNKDISKNDKDKKMIIKKENKIKKNNKKRNVPLPMVNKRKLDKYIFNKLYIKKLEHLEKLTNKEYKFQKGVLRNKSYEQLPNLNYEPDKCRKDAEFYFFKGLDEKLKILEEKLQNLGESEKKDYYIEQKLKRKILSYKTKACISLDYKDKEKYNKIIREINSEEKEEEKKRNNNRINLRMNSENFSTKKINENNNIQMNILGGKIEKIEKKISNSLHKIKNKENKKYTLEKQNLTVKPRNKSTKEIKRNPNLIHRLLGNNRISLKLDKEFIENNRKSINMKTNIFSKARMFLLDK